MEGSGGGGVGGGDGGIRAKAAIVQSVYRMHAVCAQMEGARMHEDTNPS